MQFYYMSRLSNELVARGPFKWQHPSSTVIIDLIWRNKLLEVLGSAIINLYVTLQTGPWTPFLGAVCRSERGPSGNQRANGMERGYLSSTLWCHSNLGSICVDRCSIPLVNRKTPPLVKMAASLGLLIYYLSPPCSILMRDKAIPITCLVRRELVKC